jgi:hypothetical protein
MAALPLGESNKGKKEGGTYMRRKILFLASLVLVLVTATLGNGAYVASFNSEEDYEVWAIDQSNSPGKTFGGTLYIYSGKDLIKKADTAAPEVIDLGTEVSDQCLEETGANPVRPHIISFNASSTHAIIAFVASGHVVFMDAATRTPTTCLRMSPGAIDPTTEQPFRQAHAAFPAPNERYVIVANQNGKLLERIDTDANNNGTPYENASDIVHDTDATLDLASCETPNGTPCETPGEAPRPNNAVICPIIDRTSTLTFVTLAGGGLLVVDTSADGTVPPIVAEYDNSTVHPNGCGGMQRGVETESRIYLNSGAGGTNEFEADLYSFPLSEFPVAPDFNKPNEPEPTVVFSFDTEGHDSHGMLLNRKQQGRFLWVADRAANTIEVVDTTSDTHVNTFSLEDGAASDPAPDLMDISPDGKHAFISLRGPCPLTANIPDVNNAVGANPGVQVVQVKEGGFSGGVVGIAPINNVDESITNCAPDGAPESNNLADPHGIAVRSPDDKEDSK